MNIDKNEFIKQKAAEQVNLLRDAQLVMPGKAFLEASALVAFYLQMIKDCDGE